MSQKYIDDQLFKGTNFQEKKLEKGNYENCQFIDCVFAEIKLNFINFIDCQFTNCDFSNAKLTDTGLKKVQFSNCKLIGLRFDSCNDFLFEATFIDSRLDFSIFTAMNLQKCHFSGCSLQEVDFSAANLSGVKFEHSNLSRTVFEQSNLEQTDFQTATNFSIDPSINRMNQAHFSTLGLVGLLRKYNLTID